MAHLQNTIPAQFSSYTVYHTKVRSSYKLTWWYRWWVGEHHVEFSRECIHLICLPFIARLWAVYIVPAGGDGWGRVGQASRAKPLHVVGRHSDKVRLSLCVCVCVCVGVCAVCVWVCVGGIFRSVQKARPISSHNTKCVVDFQYCAKFKLNKAVTKERPQWVCTTTLRYSVR